MADEPLTLVQAAFMEAVRPTPAGRPPRMPAPVVPDALAAHGCLHAAVVVYRGRKVWFPCRSHEGGRHNFAAHWPACPAPFCRLAYSHHEAGTMHDIPAGTVEYHDTTGKEADGG
jgi:hypothetical protein